MAVQQTLDNIAYEIIELIRPTRVDDSDIDLRLIKERINDLRALYLYRELSSLGPIEQTYVQTLGCVAVESIDTVECPQLSGTNTILRTTVKIPKPLEIKGKLLFTRIGPTDLRKANFNYYNYSETFYSEFNRFSRNLINTYYLNGYIYIYADECVDFIKLIDKIEIRLVLEDPTTVFDSDCFDTTEDYPISRWMKENIIKTIVQEMGAKISQPDDKINDGANQ